MNSPDLAVIIPAFNEESTIRDVMMRFHQELPPAGIYVIDNNSGDRTAQIARATLAELSCRGTVLFENRRGKANAVRKAFSEVDADLYVMVDADNTYSARDVHRLIDPVVAREADMTVGDRHASGAYERENKRRFHGFGNALVRKLINYLFKSELKDILSGYRAFSRRFVKNFPIMRQGFTLETELTLHALDKRFSIREVPIEYQERPLGSTSKINTLGDGIEIIRYIFDIFKDYRPLAFFGVCSVIFFCLGFIAGLPVIIEFIKTRFILHIPLAILSTGLMLFSVVSLAIGIILDAVVKNHRFQYELSLLRYSTEKR